MVRILLDKMQVRYQNTFVAGIDDLRDLRELRILRDRAKVRLEVALDMQRKAAEHYKGTPTGFQAWKKASESAIEAKRSFKDAQEAYSKALAAVSGA